MSEPLLVGPALIKCVTLHNPTSLSVSPPKCEHDREPKHKLSLTMKLSLVVRLSLTISQMEKIQAFTVGYKQRKTVVAASAQIYSEAEQRMHAVCKGWLVRYQNRRLQVQGATS